MHEEQTMAQFYADLESKWNNQFDMTSSNSVPMGRGSRTKAPMMKSQGAYEPHADNSKGNNTTAQHHTVNSNNMQTQGGVWNVGGFYNSPFFLIPTNTNN